VVSFINILLRLAVVCWYRCDKTTTVTRCATIIRRYTYSPHVSLSICNGGRT